MNVDLKVRRFPVWPVVAAGHVVEKVCKPLGINPPIFPRRVDWYRQNRAFRIDKAKRELGYRPAVSLDDGLRRTYEWYRSEGLV
jgi:nucleoside-diphosphate-sugar epimerase